MKKNEKKNNSEFLNEKVRLYSKRSNDEILKEFNVDVKKGLNEDQVMKSAQLHGYNTIQTQKKESNLKKFMGCLFSLFNVILLCIAILNGFISYFFPESENEKKTFYFTPVIILVIVLISSILSYRENLKSERSANALKNISSNTSTVIRNGKTMEINNGELVVGDIIRFSSGDMVPAEIRILNSKDLYVMQASLTGESTPVEKSAQSNSMSNPFDLKNILFNGSSVLSGTGIGIVFSIAEETFLGQLNKTVNEKKKDNPFQAGIHSITKLLLVMISIIVPIIFLIDGFDIHFESSGLVLGNYTSGATWINAFIFSVSVAVCLIPSLLPMQVASNLAKGAVNMSKKKVVVKDINTIFNFGSMDVLCTDKTGTLTENSSTLSRYFDIDSNPSMSILRLAFLNSYFQTGIKSVIDKSILEYANKNKVIQEMLDEGLTRLDEIPFDFQRKRLSVLLIDKKGERFMITKGAVENMLSIISEVKTSSGKRTITEQDKERILRIAEEEASRGKRTLILATKDIKNDEINITSESNMTFIGFLSFEDTPKKGVRKAMESLMEYGVQIKILTGDSLASSLAICDSIHLENVKYLTGEELSHMDDTELVSAVEEHNLFVKLSPLDKQRIVEALKKNRHVVGFMGDGINDAAALKSADVGISFRDASDIAKEAADIIMLENDLTVLKEGIREGRKSYINMMKYVKGQTSSNFGNMISQSIGALWIPFSPLKAVHIILLDIISDISCSMIPFDNVDEKDIRKPLNFSIEQIRGFMFLFGPLSSLLDMASFAILLYFICPLMLKNNGITYLSYSSLDSEGKLLFLMIFQTGFFIESLITQNVVYTFLRSDRIPFVKTKPSITLLLGILVSCLIGFFIVYVPSVNEAFDLVGISPIFIGILFGFVLIYGLLTQIAKHFYVKRYSRLL
jgi:P-type Mg2+ transporter